MKDFQYAAPESLQAAIDLMAQYAGRARPLAGGTDILVQLREGQRDAEAVVDLKRIDELMELDYSVAAGLRLGASVPCWRISECADVVSAYPALVDATQIIGGWQIQSRASVGGNLCNSSPAADAIPPLIVHQGVCHIAGPGGRRSIPVDGFCTGPGGNVLQSGELLVCMTLGPPPPRSSSAYERFIPRNEMDIAVAGAASWVQVDESGGRIEQARIALAAVAPTPVFAAEASMWLAGRDISSRDIGESTFSEAGELAKQVVAPIDDMRGTVEYRTHLAGVLTQRTLCRAVQRARGSAGK